MPHLEAKADRPFKADAERFMAWRKPGPIFWKPGAIAPVATGKPLPVEEPVAPVAPEPPDTRACEWCSKTFTLPKNNPRARCCSRLCANKKWRAHQSFPEQQCPVCRETFRPKHNGYKTPGECCSKRCAGKLSARRRKIRAGAKLGGMLSAASGKGGRPRVDPEELNPAMYRGKQCRACVARGRQHVESVYYVAAPRQCVYCARFLYAARKAIEASKAKAP
jgi:hypothetical protein